MEKMEMRQWKIVAQDRQEWKAIVNAAKSHEDIMVINFPNREQLDRRC